MATNRQHRPDVNADRVSTNSYTAYDALGQVTGYNQQTGQDYAMTYEYDLAGNMKKEVYPSLKTVITEYDDAGRIAGVKKQLKQRQRGVRLDSVDI